MITIVIQFIKKGMFILKRFLFISQMILGILLVFFVYKQMNQDHLDTWFIAFTAFYLIFLIWNAECYNSN